MMQKKCRVEILPLETEMMGEKRAFNAAVIWNKEDVILVDAGLPGMFSAIKDAMGRVGADFDKLRKIILTHHDRDHVGSVSAILAAANQDIEVLAHALEKPYIECEDHLMSKIEKMVQTMPEEQQEPTREAYRQREAITVNRTLIDGEELPYCGGIIVIHTPGHTPGHICLYVKETKTLITGDATVSNDGRLTGPVPMFTTDLDQAVKSLAKLKEYDIEEVICYHGGIVKGNIKEQLQDLLK